LANSGHEIAALALDPSSSGFMRRVLLLDEKRNDEKMRN